MTTFQSISANTLPEEFERELRALVEGKKGDVKMIAIRETMRQMRSGERVAGRIEYVSLPANNSDM
jgi:hypothetical protein